MERFVSRTFVFAFSSMTPKPKRKSLNGGKRRNSMFADLIVTVAVFVFGFALYSVLCDFVEWGFGILEPVEQERGEQ